MQRSFLSGLSTSQLFITLFAAALLFLFALQVYAWTGPTAAPPNGNVAAPINVGTTDQVKNAGLSLNSLLVAGNALVYSPSATVRLGIDTQSPVTALDVNGSVKIANGGELHD